VKLELKASAAEYRAWAEWVRQNPPNEHFLDSDVNDAMIVWAYARSLYNDEPDLRDKLIEATPVAVARAVDDLGIFMGAMNLCQMVGVAFDSDRMGALFGNPVPEVADVCPRCNGKRTVPVLDGGTLPRPKDIPLPEVPCPECAS
jgi:hypothetical protein